MRIKQYLLLLLLSLVVATGIPFDPIANFAFEFTKYLGIDIPMTPLTSDMAMMSDNLGTTSYDKRLKLFIVTSDGEEELKEKLFKFYSEKIPLHLFYEIISDQEYSAESKHYLCKKLERLTSKKIVSFNLKTDKDTKEDQMMGFNKNWVCYE